jgi:nitrous oxidase accessory protein NosD
MKRNLYVGRVLLALLFFLTISPDAEATLANRVFVSARSGNDANACSNINTPCQTLAGAVAQLNPGGEALVLDTGGYGAVTITQSVTIAAPPGVLAFIHPPSGGDAATVNAPGATVVLRGLTLEGAGAATGNGITITAVSVLHVENCVISGFAGTSGVNGSGIYFASAGQLFVKDAIIRGNGYVGIWVHPLLGPAKASVDRCRLEENAAGLVSDFDAQVTIRDSVASGNSYALESEFTGELNVEGCLIANNQFGLASFSGGTLRVSNCTVTDNGTGLFAPTGALLSRSNNTVQGNTTKGAVSGTYLAE